MVDAPAVLSWVAAAALAAGVGAASAGQATWTANPGVLPGGGWQFTPGTTFADPPPSNRGWTNGVYGTVGKGWQLTEPLSIAGRAGALAVEAKSVFSLATGLGAVARCLAGGPVCAALTLAAAAYAEYRIKTPAEVDPRSGVAPGQVAVDAGKDPRTVLQKKWECGGQDYYPPASAYTYASAPEACTAYAQSLSYTQTVGCNRNPSGVATVGRTVSVGEPISLTAFWLSIHGFDNCAGTQYNDPRWDRAVARSIDGVPSTLCDPFVDPFDPAVSYPGGSVGPDGKCPTGRYTGRTPQQAADAVAGAARPPDVADQKWGDAVRDSIGAWGQPALGNVPGTSGGPAPASITVSGPASQTGQPVTTTTQGPSGSSTSTTAPTYNYNYAGNTITVTTNNITTTVDNSTGATTITTTTGTTKPPDPQNPDDPCTDHPERVGCKDLGQAPTEETPKSQQALTAQDESIGLPSGCPASIDIGDGRVLSYQPTCDALSLARPFIIAAAAMMSMLIGWAALRSS